jgi:hypothetical protein
MPRCFVSEYGRSSFGSAIPLPAVLNSQQGGEPVEDVELAGH